MKDGYELTTLRRAGRLLSDVAAEVLRAVRAGQTERDLALDIDWRIRRAGFERTAFETIVASGPQCGAAARPSDGAKFKPKAISSCWTLAGSTTHTAWT